MAREVAVIPVIIIEVVGSQSLPGTTYLQYIHRLRSMASISRFGFLVMSWVCSGVV
jgi:hypothetical protein